MTLTVAQTFKEEEESQQERRIVVQVGTGLVTLSDFKLTHEWILRN